MNGRSASGISTEPSATAQDNVPFAQQPVLLLRDAFNNPVGSAAVTAIRNAE